LKKFPKKKRISTKKKVQKFSKKKRNTSRGNQLHLDDLKKSHSNEASRGGEKKRARGGKKKSSKIWGNVRTANEEGPRGYCIAKRNERIENRE